MIEKKTQGKFRKSLPNKTDYDVWMAKTRELAFDLMKNQSIRILANHHGAPMDDRTYGAALGMIQNHFSSNKKDEHLWVRNAELFSREIRKQFPLELMQPKTKDTTGTTPNDIYTYLLAKNKGSHTSLRIDNSILLDILSKIIGTPIQDSSGKPYEKFSDLVQPDSPDQAPQDSSIFMPVDNPEKEQTNTGSSQRQSMQRITPLLGERSLAYPPRIVFARSDGSIASEGPQQPPVMTNSRVQTESQPFTREFVRPKFGSNVEDQPAYPVVSSVKPEWPGRRVDLATDAAPVQATSIPDKPPAEKDPATASVISRTRDELHREDASRAAGQSRTTTAATNFYGFSAEERGLDPPPITRKYLINLCIKLRNHRLYNREPLTVEEQKDYDAAEQHPVTQAEITEINRGLHTGRSGLSTERLTPEEERFLDKPTPGSRLGTYSREVIHNLLGKVARAEPITNAERQILIDEGHGSTMRSLDMTHRPSVYQPGFASSRAVQAPTIKTFGLRIKLSSGTEGSFARALNLQRRIAQLAGVSDVTSAGLTNGTALFNIKTTSDMYGDISDSVSKLIQEDAIFSKLENGVGTFVLTDGPHDDRGSAATRQVTSIPDNSTGVVPPSPTGVAPPSPTVVTPPSPTFELSGEMVHTNIQFPTSVRPSAINKLFAPYKNVNATLKQPIFAHYHANDEDPSAPPIFTVTHDKGASDFIGGLVDTWNETSKTGAAQILPPPPVEGSDEVI